MNSITPDTHPELLQGEVFLTNSDSVEFHRIGRKTKRVGKTAYDVQGKVLRHSFPVFVKASELEAAGIKP